MSRGSLRSVYSPGPLPGSSQSFSRPVISSIGSGLARSSHISVVFNPVVQAGNTQVNLHLPKFIKSGY